MAAVVDIAVVPITVITRLFSKVDSDLTFIELKWPLWTQQWRQNFGLLPRNVWIGACWLQQNGLVGRTMTE